MTSPLVRWGVPLGFAGVFLLIPTPAGLEPYAWRYFAVFAFVVVGLMTEPLPGPAVGILGVTVAATFRLVGNTPAESIRWALGGFSNETVWLVFSATTFALGYEATGLGRRIALWLVSTLGSRTLGLGYAIALTDLVLSPFMPSNTARSAGAIFPVVKSIPPLYDSSPTKSPRAIGAYLCWTAFATTAVTSSMFVTSMAPNLLASEMARKVTGLDITWTGWMIGFLPVGIILFLVTPFLTYLIYPPTITKGDRVVSWAGGELGIMGSISRKELTMAALAIVALVGWIAGGAYVSAVTVSLIVISCMLLAGVVSWDDILSNRQGWNVLVWFATLVAMADGLSQVGFITWFAERSGGGLAGVPAMAAAIGIIAIFYFIHYLFASTTAHTTAVLPAFLAVTVALPGIPTTAVAMVLVFSLGIMSVLTPYATGPAPVWFNAGYISSRDFWRLGFIMGVLYIGTLIAVGLPWAMRLTGAL